MRTQRSVSFAFLSVFLFAACGGQVGDPASLTVDPSPVSLEPGEALAFAARGHVASGGRLEPLAWSVQESGGGTVDAAGNYMTPNAEGTFHVVAASTVDARRKASVTVDVRWRGIRVRIAPSVTSLSTGASTNFYAYVRGTRSGQSTAVSWSVQEGASGGTISTS